MESGLVERNYPDSSNEVASMLSSSHKRVKCISPAVFGTAPEAKRSMLYFNNGVDLPALAIAEQENMASLGSMSESYSGLVERFANVKTNVNELKDENRFEGTHNARDSGDQNSPTLRQLIFQCDLSPDIIELNNNRNYDETKVAEKDSIDRLYEEICRIVNRQSVSSGSSSSSSSSDAAKMLTNGLPCSRNISANIAANIVKINEEGRSAAEEREHTAIAKMNLYTPADSIAEKENDNIGNRKKILYEVEDRDAMTNIASTTDYIGSLMKLVGDSSFNNTSTSSENIDAYISRDVEKDTKLYDHVVPTDKKYGTEEVNDEITHVIQSADEDDRKEKNVSADEDLYNKEVLQSEEEDDYLLNNLPKSVDDFQSRDYRLKLVRNLSSPRALSNVLQSPGYESSLPSAASLTPASVAVKNAFSFNGNVIWNGESSTFSSARAAFVGSYINSRTMSNASENPLDNDVDPNDLEVAMINESFEEQLKQTRIYQRDDLRDIFYGAPSNTALTTDCGVPLAQKMFFSNSPIDPNQPSTSSMGMYLNVTSASDDSDADVAKLDAMVAENLLHMRDHTIVPHDETDDDDDYDDENDDDNDVKDEGDEDNISKDESFASDVDKRDGTPVCSRRNLFIPVLTPQSRQLVMQQRKSFARTGKYRIPTMAPAAVVNNKDDVFPNGYPLLDPQLFERSTEKFADDAETARVLAHEDILNNFGLTTPANRVYSIGDDKSSTSRNTCAQTTSNDNNQQKHDSGKLFSNAVWEAICSNNIQSEKSPDVARMAANLPPEFRAMFISGSERMEISPYLTSLMTYDDQLPIGDVNEIVETRNDADELSDNAIAEMVAYNAVRMVIDSPIFMNEDGESEKIATSTPKNTACKFSARLPCFEMLNVRKCDTSSEEAAGDTTTYNSGGDDDLGGVAEEDGSIELSTADIVDSTSDFTHSLSMARLLFDDTDEFDEAEKFKSLNLNNNNSKDVVDREDEVETQGTLELPNTFGLPMSVTTAGLAASSASSSMSSFSMMDKSPKTDSNADEQTVPVLDSWEHLDDDEELANKMISEAKAKIKAQQSDDAAFSNHASTCSSPVVINTNENDVLGEMPHVIEASYSGTVRSEEEVAAAIRQLSGGATDVWYRKVDAKHYLIIFSNADRASDAMLIKCRTTFLQLNSLDHASGVTRRAAVAQKSQLLPKRNRPATTVKVARRLIENALEMRIDVTPEQREKEMRQLAEAKENKASLKLKYSPRILTSRSLISQPYRGLKMHRMRHGTQLPGPSSISRQRSNESSLTARTFSFVPLVPINGRYAQIASLTNEMSVSTRATPRVHSNRRSAFSLADQSFTSRYSRTFGRLPPINAVSGALPLVKQPHISEMTTPTTRSIGLRYGDITAERLNRYIDQKQDGRLSGEARILDNATDRDAVNVTFRDPELKTTRERWRQNFRIALPHIGLVFLSAAYTLLGATIFHHFETPYEMHIRNATSQRVQVLKDKIIRSLLTLATQAQRANDSAAARLSDEFWHVANNGMNAVIKDVFVDYTRHYMTPDDIIYGAGPTKWSFGSSVFFSWTAITTIGYGHIVPLTLEGRISCLLYALFGIPLILVTIADMGRFLSGGIIWVHNTLRKIRKGTLKRCRCFCRMLCCQIFTFWGTRKLTGSSAESKSLHSANAATMLTTSNAIAIDAMPLADGTIPVEANGSAQRGDGKSAALLDQLMSNMKKKRRRSKRKQKPNSRQLLFRRGSHMQLDTVSDAGTFEDISEIRTQEDSNDKTLSSSEDTHARADALGIGDGDGTTTDDDDDDDEDEANDEDLEEESAPDRKSVINADDVAAADDEDDDDYDALQAERRVSVLFILVVMLGYTAGGACLMQLWERWKFVDAFYFCFVTVTTIGFGDIVPQNVDFLPATLAYIVVGLIITTMCIDLVGSEYIRDIHFYGRTLGRSFLTIGGKVVHLGEVFSYVAFLQKSYGLTPDQLDRLAQLPEEYLLDCLINGRQPDLNWIGGRPFIPPDIYYFKWIEQPRTLSFTSERVLASVDSELDLNTSRCSTARTLTPREYYQKILVHYCKQMQQQHEKATAAAVGQTQARIATTTTSGVAPHYHSPASSSPPPPVRGIGSTTRSSVIRSTSRINKEAVTSTVKPQKYHSNVVR